jgi:hypothetical protein
LLATADTSIRETATLRTPEAEETILSVLAEFIRDGIDLDGTERTYQPTSAEILQVCKQRAPGLFEKFSPTGIGTRLRAYGVTSGKSGGRREFRTSLDKLRDIQERYGIDLDL